MPWACGSVSSGTSGSSSTNVLGQPWLKISGSPCPSLPAGGRNGCTPSSLARKWLKVLRSPLRAPVELVGPPGQHLPQPGKVGALPQSGLAQGRASGCRGCATAGRPLPRRQSGPRRAQSASVDSAGASPSRILLRRPPQPPGRARCHSCHNVRSYPGGLADWGPPAAPSWATACTPAATAAGPMGAARRARAPGRLSCVGFGEVRVESNWDYGR